MTAMPHDPTDRPDLHDPHDRLDPSGDPDPNAADDPSCGLVSSVHPDPSDHPRSSGRPAPNGLPGQARRRALGLDADDVAAALAAVRPPDAPAPGLEELLGRAAWSAVCEPGDRHAGALVAALGPATVLDLAAGDADALAARLAGTTAWEESFAAGAEWPAAVARWSPRLDLDRVLQHCRNAARLGARLVVPGDAEWPSQLDDLGDRTPMALWVRGDAAALAACDRAVSIVGARACTDYGARVAGELAAGAADAGLAIVSGGAYGIDAAAHRVAVASAGTTVAVFAGGVDRWYPASNAALFERVLERGAIVSELPVGQAPTRWRFIQRNRLIAALGQGTVLVEAGARSGALHTARDALELGRGVGAVPGPVTSAASTGCHELVRGGLAELITTPEQLVQFWLEHSGGSGWASGPEVAVPLIDLPAERRSPQAQRARDALGVRAWRDVAELAQRAGMTELAVRGALAELEVIGEAIEAGGKWRRR